MVNNKSLNLDHLQQLETDLNQVKSFADIRNFFGYHPLIISNASINQNYNKELFCLKIDNEKCTYLQTNGSTETEIYYYFESKKIFKNQIEMPLDFFSDFQIIIEKIVRAINNKTAYAYEARKEKNNASR